jgi:hypothetical protein
VVFLRLQYGNHALRRARAASLHTTCGCFGTASTMGLEGIVARTGQAVSVWARRTG